MSPASERAPMPASALSLTPNTKGDDRPNPRHDIGGAVTRWTDTLYRLEICDADRECPLTFTILNYGLLRFKRIYFLWTLWHRSHTYAVKKSTSRDARDSKVGRHLPILALFLSFWIGHAIWSNLRTFLVGSSQTRWRAAACCCI